jgi:hypothetical protein
LRNLRSPLETLKLLNLPKRALVNLGSARFSSGHPQEEEKHVFEAHTNLLFREIWQPLQVSYLETSVSPYRSSISLNMPASFLPSQVRQPLWAWAGCVLVRLHRRAPRHAFGRTGPAGRPAHGPLPHPGGDRTAAVPAARAEALTGKNSCPELCSADVPTVIVRGPHLGEIVHLANQAEASLGSVDSASCRAVELPASSSWRVRSHAFLGELVLRSEAWGPPISPAVTRSEGEKESHSKTRRMRSAS